MTDNFSVIVNGFPETATPNTSIAQLIYRCKEQDRDLIVELNGKFVYTRDYETTMVSPNDQLEFIHPNFGG
jgi:thiamine biosynthesis protein ThiS